MQYIDYTVFGAMLVSGFTTGIIISLTCSSVGKIFGVASMMSSE